MYLLLIILYTTDAYYASDIFPNSDAYYAKVRIYGFLPGTLMLRRWGTVIKIIRKWLQCLPAVHVASSGVNLLVLSVDAYYANTLVWREAGVDAYYANTRLPELSSWVQLIKAREQWRHCTAGLQLGFTHLGDAGGGDRFPACRLVTWWSPDHLCIMIITKAHAMTKIYIINLTR